MQALLANVYPSPAAYLLLLNTWMQPQMKLTCWCFISVYSSMQSLLADASCVEVVQQQCLSKCIAVIDKGKHAQTHTVHT